MGFSTPSYGLSDLFARVNRGDIQLPDFQREYLWDEDRIRALLVTVLRGYPMGSLLALDTRNEKMRFRPRPIAGAPDTGRDPGLLLLDGQQRLTSLYHAMSGDGRVATRDFRGKAITRAYYVDVAKAVEEDILPDEAVFAVDADGRVASHFGPRLEAPLTAPEAAIAAGCVPVASLLTADGADLLFAMAHDSVADSAVLAAFNDRVMRTVSAYDTPMIRLSRQTANAGIGSVFAQANSLGLQMDVGDLLTSVFASEDPDFQLAEHWRGIQKSLSEYPALRSIDRQSFLSAVALYVTARQDHPGGQREDILQLSLRDYLDAADVLRVTFREAGEFLEQRCIIGLEYVPYTRQLVPLAVILARLAQHPGALSETTAWDKINRWFWCGIFGELYGSSSVSLRAARDVGEVVRWVLSADAPVPLTVQDARFAESRLFSAGEETAVFRAFYALLMAQGAKDWRTGQPFRRDTVERLQPGFHPVFPLTWCKRHHIDPVLAGSVLNRTPMGKRTEVVLDGFSPDRYLARVQSKSLLDDEEFDAVLASHNLDVEYLHGAQFADFISDRRERYLKMVEHAMGKEVYRDVDERDYAAGTEGPQAFSE